MVNLDWLGHLGQLDHLGHLGQLDHLGHLGQLDHLVHLGLFGHLVTVRTATPTRTTKNNSQYSNCTLECIVLSTCTPL